ncbi:MAG: cobalt-precorrin-6A reductase [Paracoccus sp. (in: a-proteobacteria)]|uniref:cobalt-precorrin-6A reductase n=1 Tax=Paracoccus sp. TaxID=267 RepID=UPI0026DF481D|nr:cobalt-precorrin-6A reductase [Paracoccus sp. (in: a-proteobacteria)]MDO5631836.1 cobalt-precorrin-6A reductase [Paracoccus sp. (in: a-proteobacteria)]
MQRILILGGTLDASALATALAERGADAMLSYAGRTRNPRAQPLPMRIGGFGGAQGLADYLRREGITHLIDATHPFAAAISRNAVAAAQITQTPLIALTRPPWQPGPGDNWRIVPDIAAAVAALSGPPRRVMLALGRMHLPEFAAQPQHHYLLRLVDAPDQPPPLPHHQIIVDRGPFTVAGDLARMRDHGTEIIVAKNAGGRGADAKLAAARALRLPVILIDRPVLPPRPQAVSVAEVLAWLDHPADLGV